MNKYHNYINCNKKVKVPGWFKYSPGIKKKFNENEKSKELFIKYNF